MPFVSLRAQVTVPPSREGYIGLPQVADTSVLSWSPDHERLLTVEDPSTKCVWKGLQSTVQETEEGLYPHDRAGLLRSTPALKARVGGPCTRLDRRRSQHEVCAGRSPFEGIVD